MRCPALQRLRRRRLRGNPAGVVLDAQGMDEVRTQQVAAEVGFPETASLTSDEGLGERRCRIRYFRPVAEVGFCGRDDRQRRCAGRAAGRTGELWLVTSVGEVRVGTWPGNGRILASLTSVAPAVREVTRPISALSALPSTMVRSANENSTPSGAAARSTRLVGAETNPSWSAKTPGSESRTEPAASCAMPDGATAIPPERASAANNSVR